MTPVQLFRFVEPPQAMRNATRKSCFQFCESKRACAPVLISCLKLSVKCFAIFLLRSDLGRFQKNWHLPLRCAQRDETLVLKVVHCFYVPQQQHHQLACYPRASQFVDLSQSFCIPSRWPASLAYCKPLLTYQVRHALCQHRLLHLVQRPSAPTGRLNGLIDDATSKYVPQPDWGAFLAIADKVKALNVDK